MINRPLAAIAAFLFTLSTALWPALALAQQITGPAQVGLACAYNASPATATTGNYVLVQCDSTGHLLTTPGGATSPSVGAATIATGQYSNATASATQIVAARTGVAGTGRVSVTLYNSGSVAVYIGITGVTTATGIRILPTGSYTLYTTAAVFGVPASGTGTLDYLETY